jgi:hypothetical protein
MKKTIVRSNLWMWLVNEPWPHNHSVELGMQYKEFVLQVTADCGDGARKSADA